MKTAALPQYKRNVTWLGHGTDANPSTPGTFYGVTVKDVTLKIFVPVPNNNPRFALKAANQYIKGDKAKLSEQGILITNPDPE